MSSLIFQRSQSFNTKRITFFFYFLFTLHSSVSCKDNTKCKNFRHNGRLGIGQILKLWGLRTRRFSFVYRDFSEKCSREIRFVSGRKVKNKARLREQAVINLGIPSENPACTLKTGTRSRGILAVRS